MLNYIHNNYNSMIIVTAALPATLPHRVSHAEATVLIFSCVSNRTRGKIYIPPSNRGLNEIPIASYRGSVRDQHYRIVWSTSCCYCWPNSIRSHLFSSVDDSDDAGASLLSSLLLVCYLCIKTFVFMFLPTVTPSLCAIKTDQSSYQNVQLAKTSALSWQVPNAYINFSLSRERAFVLLFQSSRSRERERGEFKRNLQWHRNLCVYKEWGIPGNPFGHNRIKTQSQAI